MKPKTFLGIATSAVLVGAVLEGGYSISSQASQISRRVEKSLQDPVSRITNAIKYFSDQDFIDKHKDANRKYYELKGIEDEAKLDKIVQTATNYDIAVQLQKDGIITMQDIIEHISQGGIRIVCESGACMTQTWTPTGGKTQKLQKDDFLKPEDRATSFVELLNNQEAVTGTFTERPQGGGYYLTITDKKTRKVLGVFEQAFKIN